MMDVDDMMDNHVATSVRSDTASDAERYVILKGAVKDAPADYTAHLSLVGYLREHRPGSLDLLKARQEFSSRFPLSPELWQEWIEDRRSAGGEDAVEEVLALYARAFEDYQCAKLCPGYLEVLEESLDEDDDGGVDAMRDAFEEVLVRAGVHPVQGGAVWSAYTRFEKDELEDAEETGAGEAEITTAQERVKKLYRRRLSVPLVGNEEVLPEMREAFEGDEEVLEVGLRGHANASEMLTERMEHEEAVARCQQSDPGGPGAANAWETYAAMEAAEGHPSRAVLVLERAESEGCCLHERIWITHSDLLLARMGDKGKEATLTKRAVRNLPWSAELWCRRLRSLERTAECSSEVGATGATEAAEGMAAVRNVWREALASALPSPDDYVKVLLAYCSLFRRRLVSAIKGAAKAKAATSAAPPEIIGPAYPTPSKVEVGRGGESSCGGGVTAALEGVRGAFEEAEAFVDKNYPGWDEGWLTVVRQRIQVEDEVVEDLAELGLEGVLAESQARRQWDRVLRHSGKRLAAWLEAVAWERRVTGDLVACRRLFARSMKEVEDYPEAAYSAFLNFEQEVGSLDDWDAANVGVFASRMSRGLLSRDLPLASRAWSGGAAARPLHQPTQRQRNTKKDANSGGNLASASGGEHDRHAKRAGTKRGQQQVRGDADGEDSSGAGSRAGGAASNKRARTSAARGGEEGEGQGGEEEGLTAFVVNLAFSVKDAGLKAMFKKCGAVTRSRVLTNQQRRSKGMGYVTFESEEALSKALALDGTEIDGRTMSVRKSLPRGSRPPKGGGASTSASASANRGVSDRRPPATAAADAAPSSAGVAADSKGSDVAGGLDAVKAIGGGGGESRGGNGGSLDGDGTEGEEGKGKKKKKKKKKDKGDVVEGSAGGIKWPVHPTTVFVTGLGSGATSAGLREAFLPAGAVVEARVVEDKKTHKTKGYGLVQFEEPAAIEKALALSGTDMCGGKVKVTRSRHPAVVASAPSPAPANASPGIDGTPVAAATAGGSSDVGTSSSSTGAPGDRRADDWECLNPECDNVCFSFRTKCNRCGTGKDGTPPVSKPAFGGGGLGGGSAGEVPTMHRPRLHLGSAIRPRALRKEPVGNGDAVAQASEKKGGAGAGEGDMPPPPPSKKTNADFRAMLNKK